MSAFIGRKYELDRLCPLARDAPAKLVVVKGRRRIGKSRLAEELGRRLEDHRTVYFEAALPEKHETEADERQDFAQQIGLIFNVPAPPFADWADLFWHLADRIKDTSQKTLVIFDEINWILGPVRLEDTPPETYPHRLTDRVDETKRPKFCGICRARRYGFHSAGAVAAKPRSFGATGARAPAHDKFRYLAVSGGAPRYLEAMDPTQVRRHPHIESLLRARGAPVQRVRDGTEDFADQRPWQTSLLPRSHSC